jgi:site-specific recombinase XerD
MYAPETLLKFEECFRKWVSVHLGHIAVAELSLMHLMELKAAMAAKGLSVSRHYAVLMLVKLILRFAQSTLKIACIDPNEIKLPRRKAVRVQFLTELEVAAVRSAVSTQNFTSLRMRTLIEVLLSTGMRISEALSLDRNSIDRASCEAEIIGKGSKPRTVFFSPQCLQWIDMFLAFRKDDHPAIFITTGADPRRLQRGDLSKTFALLKQKSGITKKLTPHMLRHTFCTSLLHRGADITFIKELAGHQDIQTTARYYLGVDKRSLRAVLTRCKPHGWEELSSPSSEQVS